MEQSWARIEIGGLLPARYLKDLIDCLRDDLHGGGNDWRAEFDGRLNEALSGRFEPMSFNGEASWGNPSLTMAFCVEHSLPYQRSWDAGGDYDHGAAFWKPGMADEVSTDADASGDVVICLDDLKGALAAGQTLAEVIEAKAAFTGDLSPLQLTFETAQPSVLQPAGTPEGEALRIEAAFHIYETRVRSITGAFEGTGLVIAFGKTGANDGHRILAEVRLSDSEGGPHIEVETNTLEIVNG
jgi:hypothetical protein